jgi:hypothetical protein
MMNGMHEQLKRMQATEGSPPTVPRLALFISKASFAGVRVCVLVALLTG